jgi:hypothetical protein
VNDTAHQNFLGTCRIIATKTLFAINRFYSLMSLAMSGVTPPLRHYTFMAGRGSTPYLTDIRYVPNWGPNTDISAKWQK